MSATALALGYGADLALGDPRRGHPVAGFGRVAHALEHAIYAPSRPRGVLYTGALVGGAALAGAALERAAGRRTALALLTWTALGGRSLRREARAIGALLEGGDVDGARRALPALCGRDPALLDDAGIARAVVESVAENTSDAVVGTLLYGALLGPPGVAAFRAANTLDAMVGHRSPRYERFGWASARLDDLLGWPAARAGAALAVLCAGRANVPDARSGGGLRDVHRSPGAGWAANVPDARSGGGLRDVHGAWGAGPGGGGRAGAWRVLRRDGAAHPSPNAGRMEAAFAGALGLRLGGPLSYGGVAELRPSLGDDDAPAPSAADVARAVALSRRVGAATLALAAAGALAASRARRPRVTAGAVR